MTPERRRKDPLGANQCAYCKEEGPWRRNCLKLKVKDRKDENPHQEILDRKEESHDKWGGPTAPLGISQPITISPQESWVQLTVGNKLIDFLVDTGATYSLLNTKLTNRSSAAIMVTGVTGQLQKKTGVPSTSRMPAWGSKAYAVFSTCQTDPFHCKAETFFVNFMHT